MKKRVLILLISLLFFFGYSCASRQLATEAMIPYVEVTEVVVDGTIGPEEYSGTFHESATNMYIFWEHDGTDLYIGIESPGTGWVGIGFGLQEGGKDKANLIVGYIDDAGNLLLLDELGVGYQHQEDITLGGTDDILAKAGSESSVKTIIEFIFPLDSGDENDHSFEIDSTYSFFVAYHASADDFTSYHTARSQILTLYISPSSITPPEPKTKVNTTINLDVPQRVIENQSITMDARLQDESGDSVEGATIAFQRITVFGQLELGQIKTDSEGVAVLEYKAKVSGTMVFEAIYNGSENLAPASTRTSFIVEPLIRDEPVGLSILGISTGISIDRFISLLGRGVIFATLGSIALSFGYVGYQIIHLYFDKEDRDEFEEQLRFEWRR